ncbi:EF-hand domain pair [Novymonas esmeraldas]|uniref:EF-hand domain pair n=1 Tax=Novymonas esmeraldas TaxID=1808958 RepID=A0AAW0EWK5_9TRYP
MSNLKHRLSAFYPQLTSKEYKFLVEDPSGSGGASATKTSSAAVHGSSAADGGHGQSPSPVVSPSPPANLSFGGGPSPIDGGFGGGDAGLAGAGGLRAAGTRAGLDVDQLWELINSFQQLQRTLGATQGSAGDAPPTQQSRAASTAAFTASLDSYLVGSHGHANARGGDGGVGFDAVGEAFRIYDPRHSRYVEEDVLSRIMARVGFGELSEEELAVLVSTADFDGDGRISLDDFRRLVNMKGRFKK